MHILGIIKAQLWRPRRMDRCNSSQASRPPRHIALATRSCGSIRTTESTMRKMCAGMQTQRPASLFVRARPTARVIEIYGTGNKSCLMIVVPKPGFTLANWEVWRSVTYAAIYSRALSVAQASTSPASIVFRVLPCSHLP